MSLIEFNNVSVQYNTQSENEFALRDITTSIDQGTVVGITGPSEAGKSTFLRTVASYVPNYFDCSLEGEVVVDGININDTSIGEMSSRVGMLFENPFDQLTGATATVVEEVAFGLENQGLPRGEIMERTYRSLERAGIIDLMDRNPYDLSGGQSQRVALASILALRPDVLLLDEPASQLDPSGTEEVFLAVDSMNTDQFTTIIVSQNTERLAHLADRLMVFDDGALKADDTTHSVLTGPIAEENLFFTPDTVRVGKRLRAEGFINSNEPIPLRIDALVDEIRQLKKDGVAELGGELGEKSVTSNPPYESESGSPITFDDVRFNYDDVEALQGITLTIGSGCTCLIGQNGAGKSTLAKHLNGLLKPTSGRVVIKGEETHDKTVSQLARFVGLAFQNPDNQLFHDSVIKEVRFGPKNMGYDEERIMDLTRSAIEQMGLKNVTGKHPYDLGLAARKRVAVASVLAMDTEIVVLDEPTGGQDREGVIILGDIVESLVDQGKIVIVITHDMDFVRQYADRVIALRHGEILLDGDPRSVFAQDDVLEKTYVKPPAITRVGRKCGFEGTVLSIEELFECISTNHSSSV